ncbi:hypothetical protein JANAI62_29720 [Jannaschia pagri]|uniref:Uncharacterized protein n=1 Tax=Jannaschia pagri TaxID=2829797 RepID=A0ABQ4NPK9_9RHOB|nr:hypothetical protein JANAI61_29720 [Jannaschia sp. AI_61]GIT96349.1 hypothetical protein JANAI62_29720 [Jannaschia sp. AI_62]
MGARRLHNRAKVSGAIARPQLRLAGLMAVGLPQGFNVTLGAVAMGGGCLYDSRAMAGTSRRRVPAGRHAFAPIRRSVLCGHFDLMGIRPRC